MICQHSKHNKSAEAVSYKVHNVFPLSHGPVPQAPGAVLERQLPGEMPKHGDPIALPSQPHR